MKNWTVRQRIVFSFASIILAMLLVGGVAYRQLAIIHRGATQMQIDSLPAQRLTGKIASAYWENYSLTQEHVIQADKTALSQIEKEITANWTRLEGLAHSYEATIHGTQDRELFTALQTAEASYRRIQVDVLKVSADQSDAEAHNALLNDLEPRFKKLHEVMDQIVAFDNAFAETQLGLIFAAVDTTQMGMSIVFAIALLVAIASGYLLLHAITQPLNRLVAVADVMRQGDFTQRVNFQRADEFGALARGFDRMTDDLTGIVGQVQQSAVQVNTSVTEIAATAKQQQATASEIAATTSEIGATSREITATSKELAKTIGEVSTVADQAATLAGSGQTGLARMEDTMRQVMDAMTSINGKLAVLNEKAGNINQVVATITKVADQTNLLSLNAAIEAEKAGEYGRGFAVVATEIRRLADQTAVATYDIEQMVKEIQSAVSAGVMGMDKFSEEVRRGVQEINQVGGQLSQIIQQVQSLAPRVESVNEGMEAQATGAEQISQALGQLSEAAQQTVDSLRQSSLAIDGLNQVSTTLRSSVSRIKLQA